MRFVAILILLCSFLSFFAAYLYTGVTTTNLGMVVLFTGAGVGTMVFSAMMLSAADKNEHTFELIRAITASKKA